VGSNKRGDVPVWWVDEDLEESISATPVTPGVACSVDQKFQHSDVVMGAWIF